MWKVSVEVCGIVVVGESLPECERCSDLEVVELRVDDIEVDPVQVRRIFDAEGLEGLAKSIEEVGMLHPVLVKRIEGGYRLVAGERRLRAARMLERQTVPAIVLNDLLSTKQVQLVENLQRADLNPVERALAVAEFMEAEGLTKVAASERLGVPRTTLTDWLDILEVDGRFQRAVVDNFYGGDSPLTLAHVAEARAFGARMKSVNLQNALLDAVLTYKLSKGEVRQVAKIVRENADVSIIDAVRAVRRPLDEVAEEEAEIDVLPVDERNLQRLFVTLQRSRSVLSELGHISPKYLPEPERVRLITDLRELHDMIDQMIARIDAESEDPSINDTMRRKKKGPKRGNRKVS